MDFNTFYNEWIPEHCPIHPFTSCVAVHLYLDIEHKIRNLAWVDKSNRGPHLPPTFRFIIHDKDRAPIPDVKDVHPVSNKKPFIDIHYVKVEDIEMRN